MLGFEPPQNSIIIISPILALEQFKPLLQETILRSGWYKTLTGTYQGKPLTIIKTIPGAGVNGDLCLALQEHAQKIIFAGAAGALNKKLKLGDYFAATTAINGESFSDYFNSPFELPPVLTKKSNTNFTAPLPCASGKVYTCGSLLAETNYLLQELANAGIEAIEMETSALYTAAQITKIETIAVYFISDKPLEKKLFENYSTTEKKALANSKKNFIKFILTNFL